jgi:peptide/nickel transport system permease protein
VLVQYLNYLGGLLRGDLGTSYILKQPVTGVITEQLAPTVVLTLTALVLSWVIAVTVTLLTAHRSRWLSSIGSGLEIFLAALPQYWLGIVLLVVFAFQLRLLPVVGDSGPEALVLPALTLALPLAGYLGQVTRDEFSSAMEQPFAVSARARGMSDWGVRGTPCAMPCCRVSPCPGGRWVRCSPPPSSSNRYSYDPVWGGCSSTP